MIIAEIMSECSTARQRIERLVMSWRNEGICMCFDMEVSSYYSRKKHLFHAVSPIKRLRRLQGLQRDTLLVIIVILVILFEIRATRLPGYFATNTNNPAPDGDGAAWFPYTRCIPFSG
jgi:hypothetical protein